MNLEGLTDDVWLLNPNFGLVKVLLAHYFFLKTTTASLLGFFCFVLTCHKVDWPGDGRVNLVMWRRLREDYVQQQTSFAWNDNYDDDET